MYSVDTTDQFERSVKECTRNGKRMEDLLKKALEISLAEAERGEVTHYESVEELMKALG